MPLPDRLQARLQSLDHDERQNNSSADAAYAWRTRFDPDPDDEARLELLDRHGPADPTR